MIVPGLPSLELEAEPAIRIIAGTLEGVGFRRARNAVIVVAGSGVTRRCFPVSRDDGAARVRIEIAAPDLDRRGHSLLSVRSPS